MNTYVDIKLHDKLICKCCNFIYEVVEINSSFFKLFSESNSLIQKCPRDSLNIVYSKIG